MSISLARHAETTRSKRFMGRAAIAGVVLALLATVAPAGAQAAPAPAPEGSSAVGYLTTDEGFTTEVPAAYLQEGAPEWIEYDEGMSAAAVGGTCTKPLCGRIVNKGSISFRVSTDYTTNGQVAAGAVQKTIAPNVEAGAPYDWDAVLIPAGYCGTFYTGAGYYFRSTESRVGQASSRWHKIDDAGAHAIVKQGSCA
ncbi:MULTISPECIES: hypothetical protein [unclassified Rathayibacter]|nr:MULTISPECIES: hypothetical protein [unclassified Rathayibacter]